MIDIEKRLARRAKKEAAKGLISDEFARAQPYATGKEIIIRDDVLPGLTLRVGKKGKVFSYRIEQRKNGHRLPMITKPLGKWERGYTATQARKDAVALSVERDAGTIVNTSARKAKTLASVWPEFSVAPTTKGRKKAANTIEELRYSYKRLSPRVLHTPLRDLVNDQSIMQREAARIVGVHGQSASNSTVRLVRLMYKFANRDRKLPAGHPCETVTVIDPENKQPVLDWHELPAWWRKVQALKNPIHREAHTLTLLSGLRRNDVRTMRWDKLDVKGRRFHISEPKGGSRRAFDLILARPMLRCLWRVRRAGRVLYPGSPWVFPADSASGHLIRLNERVGVRNHGLRRTYSGIAKNYVGISDADIGRLLNHGGANVTQRYIRASKMGPHFLQQQEAISAALIKACVA